MSNPTDPSHNHSNGNNGNNGFDAQTDVDNNTSDVESDHDYSDDDTSSVVELEAEDFPGYFTERDGRLYHSGQSPYPLPVDAPEQERLNFQHLLFKEFFQGNCVGPEVELFTDPQRTMALDLCTGKGTWYPLENVQFEVDDVNNDLRWNNETFDLVNARTIAMAVRDCPRLIREVARVLRPGGVFVSVEWSPYPAVDLTVREDSASYAPASARFHEAINQALLNHCGLRPIAGQIHTLLANTGSFRDIVSSPRSVPVGTWSNSRVRAIGEYCLEMNTRYADSVKTLLIDSGWTEGDVDRLCDEYIREIRSGDKKLVNILYIVHARKV
ncbi:Methyltransferase pytC [Psilocybe cubensis]|uniref:Methyltransferase pytC n=1 Tax=Psilocybe cubensis TaxID=181762 RepID=A0ACB8GM47_PSICU|nr:Methyltransferase pytC [Psilocybe cubensis]KAH9476830.1 Methyltransferase pytC [Psilocybe cubensis]